jgi:hypothetical protein
MTAATPNTLADTDRLADIAAIATSLDLPRVHDEALAVARRASEGQFYVACVGQFKRGKSTLIDALLDDPVLPSGIVPVTAVPTVVRFGEQRTARVRLLGERVAERDPERIAWHTIDPGELAQYVSEEHNPENERGVLAVEVFVPSPALAHGLCLVDTPGLGSVFESNTAATRAFIPQIDAALVVIGADPPVSGQELDLIEDVARHANDLIFVLNKADRVSDAERHAASDFARVVIERRLRRQIGDIFEISATERLARAGPARDWPQLLDALESLALSSGHELARGAARRAVVRLANQALAAVREERDALLRSTEESDRHIALLAAVARDGERAVEDLGALLGAEQQRLSHRFERERAEFLAAALPQAHELLSVELRRTRGSFGPALRRDMMHAALAVARQVLEPWLSAEQAHAEAVYRESMARFVELAASFLERLASSGIRELEALRGAVDADAGFRMPSRFVFNEVLHVAEPASPFRWIADVGMGLVGRRFFEPAAHEFLAWLLEMNSSRVQGDVDQRVAASRRRLETEIRGLLREVETRAKSAAERARMARAEGAAAVDAAIRQLSDTEARLRAYVDPSATSRVPS